MERSLFDMTLDLQDSYSHTALTVKRGDTHRTLRIRLCDGGRPYRVTPETSAVFTAVKPDGAHIYNACRVEKDTVFYDLTPQTTAIPGELECELRLYSATGALLTSAAFRLTVEDTVYADGDETVFSSGEATALTKLLLEAKEKIILMQAVLSNEVDHAVIDDSAVNGNAWSSKHLADMLCPNFSKTGEMVNCLPLKGYPLEVVSTIGEKEDGSAWNSIRLLQSGKNLFSGGRELAFTRSLTLTLEKPIPPGTYVLSFSSYGGSGDLKPVIIPKYEDGSDAPYLQVLYYGNSRKVTFTKPVTKVQFWSNGYNNTSSTGVSCTLYDIQIEPGAVATEYEEYKTPEERTLDLSVYGVMAGSYNWSTGVLRSADGAENTLTPAQKKS